MNTADVLGVIAGGGLLPAALVAHCRDIGRPCAVVALDGHADQDFSAVPSTVRRLGQAGAIIDWLHAKGARDLVLAGHVRRPRLGDLRPDLRGAKLLARIGARALGDDSLLRIVADALEQEGFRLIAAEDVVAELLAPEGRIGSVDMPEDRRRDVLHGLNAARALGVADVGQAVVVQDGLVLAVEAIEGTDALIRRAASLARSTAPAPILVKARKPQQDHRLDRPTIGPDTVRAAEQAGFAGIAIEAGEVLLLERVIATGIADRAGLFLTGIAS